MSMMNHSCLKIKYKAVDILYYIFLDIEYREPMIKKLLLKNKLNFEKYFDCSILLFEDEEIIQKRNFILYELEKLNNIDFI